MPISAAPLIGPLRARVRSDSLLRNSLYLIATTIVNSAFGYLFWLLVARLFSPAAVGLASAVTAGSTIITMIAQSGIGSTLIQTLPLQRSSPAWWLNLWTIATTGAAATLVLGIAALLILPYLSPHFSDLTTAPFILVLSAGTLSGTVGGVMDSAFVAERAAVDVLTRNSVVAGSKALALLLLAIFALRTVLVVLEAWAIAATAGVAIGAVLMIRRVGRVRRPGFAPMMRAARKHATGMVGNQFISLGGALPPLLLPILVTARLSSRQNGYFYTTWMMCSILLVISPAIARSLFAEGVHSPSDLRGKTRSALAILAALLVPSMVGYLVIGGVMLSTFGPQYEAHALDLLRLLVLSAIPDAITNVYVAAMQVQRRLARAAWLNLGMGAGTLALSWVLLPMLGIVGVGWSWLAMQTAGSAVVILSVRGGGLPITRRPASTGPA